MWSEVEEETGCVLRGFFILDFEGGDYKGSALVERVWKKWNGRLVSVKSTECGGFGPGDGAEGRELSASLRIPNGRELG